jgi:outer membrane protein
MNSLVKRLWGIALAGLLTGVAAAGQNSASLPKVGTVHLQAALLKTREGQAAAAEIQRRAASKEQALMKLQSEIAALREELSKTGSVASQSRQESLAREIEQKTKVFNRQLEDLQAELDQEQNRIFNDLGSRMIKIIQKFAVNGGYGLIVDVSAAQSPVLFASEPLNVTAQIVRMFDDSEGKLPAIQPPETRQGAN